MSGFGALDGKNILGLLLTSTRGLFSLERFVNGRIRIFWQLFRRSQLESVFTIFAGRPGLRVEVRAILFNYVLFRFHSKIFIKFTYCISFVDSSSGSPLLVSLLVECIERRCGLLFSMPSMSFLLLLSYIYICFIYLCISINGAKLFDWEKPISAIHEMIKLSSLRKFSKHCILSLESSIFYCLHVRFWFHYPSELLSFIFVVKVRQVR